MKRELLIYLDPGFLDSLGHYQNYARALHAEAEKRGIDVWHFVNREARSEMGGTKKAVPVFLYKAILSDYFPENLQQPAILNAFAAKLRTILMRLTDTGDAYDRVVMYMYTSHPLYFPLIAEAINEALYNRMNIEAHLCIFYLNNAFCLGRPDPEYLAMLASVKSRLSQLDPRGKVRLYADSERTIEKYSPCFDRPIGLVPIPLAHDCPDTVAAKPAAGKRLVLGFSGYTHAKQGYFLVKQLYEAMASDPACDHVFFEIRHNIHFLTGAAQKEIEDFLSADVRIHHLLNHLTDDEYCSFFEECDVILIPHSRREYPVQTSGMFVDAVSRGKIVVVPSETWMADQVQRYGSGEVFESDDFGSLHAAVRKVVANIDSHRKNARRNTEAFARFHSAGTLLNLLGLGGTGGTPEVRTQPTELVPKSENGSGEIALLSLSLVDQHPDLVSAVYSLRDKMKKGIGWHYLLDLIWILKELRSVPKGSVVLDAGAGSGLLQFLIAGQGYKVISVDFVDRKAPQGWNIVQAEDGRKFDNEYIRHLKENYSIATEGSAAARHCGSPEVFTSLVNSLPGGSIVFYKSDLRNLSLVGAGSVDCVVSVSALEHNEHAAFREAYAELQRVLRPQGRMLVTVSASLTDDWFHEQSKGWCYSEKTLRDLFCLPNDVPSNFSEKQAIFESIKAPGNELHRNLASFYFKSANNGMPLGVWDPKYLPVGVKRGKGGTGHAL